MTWGSAPDSSRFRWHPVQGAVRAAEQIKQHAERQYYEAAQIQRQIANVDGAHAAGELTDQER
ncbi:gas vesicle protein GvpG [Saccharopolyspora pogona]|uniref:gas vesicle protein GvpG n=1 Tax=Saccharopolyspora pogona TaxID=333966 RepID=UPI0037C69DC0